MCAKIVISCTYSVTKQSLSMISHYISALLSTKIVPKSSIVFTSEDREKKSVILFFLHMWWFVISQMKTYPFSFLTISSRQFKVSKEC